MSTAGRRRVETGIEGLDDILKGGLPANRLYLVQGDPGVGKTTLALQFLMAGVRRGESTLHVTLSETGEELHAIAASHGWSLDGMHLFEMSAAETADLDHDEENTLYVPAEVELGERMGALLHEVDRVKPQRIVLDSCSELRLLAQTPLRFRRQVLALKRDLVRRDCTILLLDNPMSDEGDILLQSLVHGVLTMEQLSPLYGAERRRLRVLKMREVQYRGGYHDFRIERGGVVVFPRLVAAEHHDAFQRATLSSGVPELDSLLGGGLDRGTSTLFMGPAGAGKSALVTRYVVAAAERGEHVAMFTFDEDLGTLLARAAGLGMPLEEHIAAGRIGIQQVDPAELSPGELVHCVRQAVETRSARMIVIDSLNGYLNTAPEEQMVVVQMHELLSYLRQKGVLTNMVVAQHGLVGSSMSTPIDLSYLADTVVLLRYFEAGGRIRKAVSVMKKRSGVHEDTIRELMMSARGLTVGPPLEGFRGVLTGVPVYTSAEGPAGSRPGARST